VTYDPVLAEVAERAYELTTVLTKSSDEAALNASAKKAKDVVTDFVKLASAYVRSDPDVVARG
jgi:hypothetical protein